MEAFYRSNLPRKLQSGTKTGHRFRSKRLRHVSVVPALRVALVRDGRLFDYLTTNAGSLRRNQPSALHYLARRCMQWQELETPESDTLACRELGCASAQALERVATGLDKDDAAVLGILTDVAYSYLAGVLPISDLERVLSLTEDLGFELFHPELYSMTAELGRKSRMGRHSSSVFLLRGIGHGTETQPCDPALLEHAVRLLESWGGKGQVSWPELVGVEG